MRTGETLAPSYWFYDGEPCVALHPKWSACFMSTSLYDQDRDRRIVLVSIIDGTVYLPLIGSVDRHFQRPLT